VLLVAAVVASFPPLTLLPRPDRPVPILIGGNSRAALRRAVRLGDGWHGVRLAPEQVHDAVGRLRAGLATAGRDPPAFAWCCATP
jgi:alkanesulfonate monooxygenase SsuD/methylene tetrahydromethanopterin reductase-like flavin-dependent oxidoreductase (luciferase family)